MSSSVELITVNGRRFATGLLWQTLSKARTYMQEARDIGVREGMDIVAIRRADRVLQAGFADKSVPTKGVYSLAATLAGLLGDNWIAVFSVDRERDRYVIAGVSSTGAIVPDCDTIGDRDEILRRLREDHGLHDFERVFCPEEFDFGGEELSLEEILDPKKLNSDHKLRPLVRGLTRRQWIQAGVLIALALGASVGGLVYLAKKKAFEEEVAMIRAQNEAQQLLELEEATGVQAEPAALTKPWVMRPNPVRFRDQCTQALSSIPLSIGGWRVQSGSCSNGAVQASYQRQPGGTINSFLQIAEQLGYPRPSVDDAGETASVSWSESPLPPGGDETPQSRSWISNEVRSVLQGRDVSYSFAGAAAPPAPAGEEAPPPPPWQTFALQISGKKSPDELLAGIEDLPTLRIQSIDVRVSGSDLEWSLTGEIHGL